MKFKVLFVGLVMGLTGLLAIRPAVAAPPAISSITPAKGSMAGGATVDIMGANLGGVTAVTFGGAAARIVTGSLTHVRVVTPSQPAGTVAVAVTTPGGTAAGPSYTFEAPPPVISSIVPAKGSTAGGTMVDIMGTNLFGITAVTFGGTAAKLVTGSSTHLRVMTPARSAGVAAVAVTTPGGTATGLNYTFEAPPPAISSITPAKGNTAGGATVDIMGTNLGGAKAVTFGGTAAQIMANTATHLRIMTPARPAGVAAVVVTTPGGTATGLNYTFEASLPAISSITPAKGSTAGGTMVDIMGTNLVGITAVTFGGTAAQIMANTTTHLRVMTPTRPAGTVAVAVTTPGGTTTGPSYAFEAPSPSIHTINPASGSTAGGTTVDIMGTNLGGATAVTFGGTAAQIMANTATHLRVMTPARPAGAAELEVTTHGGKAKMPGFMFR